MAVFYRARGGSESAFYTPKSAMLSKYFLLIRNTQEIFLAESAQDILQAGRNRFSQNKKI